MTLAKRVSTLLLVLMLAACSTGFVYNRLDWLIPLYLNRYVDLDREQKGWFKVELAPLLDWHRHEELPRYLAFIDRIEQDSANELVPADIAAWIDEATLAWFRVEARGLDLLLALGEQLSDDQIEAFQDKLRERQTEYEEKYLTRSDARYLRESTAALRRNLQRFLGRLDKAQNQRVQQAAKELQRSDALWLQERALWLERIGAELQRAPGWTERVRQLAAARDSFIGDDYQRMVDHNSRVLQAAVADVLNSRSARQDQRFARELQKWRSRFERLDGAASTSVATDPVPTGT